MKPMTESFLTLNLVHILICYNVMSRINLTIAFFTNGIKDTKPYFEEVHPKNISALVDNIAILKCVVKNKGDRTISWMRKKDLHILTSNNFLYTGDQRFSVLHPPDSDEWNLKIEYVQLKDAGTYECQVNTEPKINYAVNLYVASLNTHSYDMFINEVRAKIIGSQELHIRKGSTISLTCTVNIYGSTISWYHGTEIINFDSDRGGVSMEQEKTEIGTTSRLLLTKATFQDNGNYSCVPVGALSASVVVHVLNGEIPQAMYTSDVVHPFSNTIYILIIMMSTLCNLLYMQQHIQINANYFLR